MKLTIATRGSDLALWQARRIAKRLEALGVEPHVETFSTKGDRETGAPLSALGATGLFTAELDRALLDERAHLAVHSMKDLPLEPPEGLRLAAVPERASTEDVLITTNGESLDELRPGAKLGTSSPRRAGYIRASRPDVEIVTLRGNVPTRVGRVQRGDVDATILARAGMERLGLATEAGHTLALLPAPAQGALAIVIRSGDDEVAEVVARLDDGAARESATLERAVLAGLGGGCSLPLGVAARRGGGGWHLAAELWGPEGEHAFEEGQGEDGLQIASRLAEALDASGLVPERDS